DPVARLLERAAEEEPCPRRVALLRAPREGRDPLLDAHAGDVRRVVVDEELRPAGRRLRVEEVLRAQRGGRIRVGLLGVLPRGLRGLAGALGAGREPECAWGGAR